MRPDHIAVVASASFEAKNYNIATNSNGLINDASQQAIERVKDLPAGMQQQIVIDIRGQTVTDQQKAAVIKGIVNKTGGLVSLTSIRFKAR